jgi:nucleotide-binding universal stress UspA family protein
MSVSPVARPIASASYSFVRFLGGGLAPWIAGLLAEAFLPSTPFFVGAVVVAVGILVLATAHRLLRSVETAADEPADETGDETGDETADDETADPARPVLIAVDRAPHAAEVAAAGGRLARLLGAPVIVVHVPESAAVDAAAADEGDAHLARSAEAAREAAPGEVVVETLPPVGTHGGVGAEIAALARRRRARAVVVGPPRGGALAGLAVPSADRSLWTRGPCPVVVVPASAPPERAEVTAEPPADGVVPVPAGR